MGTSFYFYDLETSGISPKAHRIMQFAGQRTDMLLKPITEPDNVLIKLSDDILPDPEAVVLTGITPQMTLTGGVTEYDFLKYFHEKIALEGTIFVGFNNVRFDDEFIRYLHYRNFYDPYEWSWKDGKSRWDILDMVRMTRALRPDGIKWPVSESGKPSNRLELLTKENNLEHSQAHDALSDVNATIAVARLIRNKQTKLFDYLLSKRSKGSVKDFINDNEMFLYTSGRYNDEHQKTTAVTSLGVMPDNRGVFVYDLRQNPEYLNSKSAEDIATMWQNKDIYLPIKQLPYNKCPAIAPMSVLGSNDYKGSIKIDTKEVDNNFSKLRQITDLYDRVVKAYRIINDSYASGVKAASVSVDSRLYDGFFDDNDKISMSAVRTADGSEVASLEMKFNDNRLSQLLPLYKIRNFRDVVPAESIEDWESYRAAKLMNGGQDSELSKYFAKISEMMHKPDLSDNDRYLLEELNLYGQTIMPDL